ncbi:MULTISPECIES: RNA polymerase sigma-70 factor [Arenibacter]|uniref:RNA polymerase sigma-70 factor n=1 Tax=Arenibacter TaxID=178469 RepID=UPI000A3B82F4|nr:MULTISPECIES: RNA polymerase sigma-70 factor [Arenibacter]
MDLDASRSIQFEEIFDLYYKRLLHIAKSYVSGEEDAEEIVLDAFLTLWEKRKDGVVLTNLSGYLFVTVKNRCLDHLRKKSRHLDQHGRSEQIEHWINYQALSNKGASSLLKDELEQQIRKAIALLPEKRRNVFVKSRVDGLSHRDISEELEISVKTVENQIGKALKHMRLHLQEFMHLFL